MVPAVTWATEINMDPSCNRTTNPDMTLSRSSGPDITMVLVAMQASQISIPLNPQQKHGPRAPTWSQVANQTPGIPFALNENRNHRYKHRLWLR